MGIDLRDSLPRVMDHYERRLARGEKARQFYIREEHLETVKRFMIENGLPNQHSALQAMLDQFRLQQSTVRDSQPAARNARHTTKDSA
ncbi:hypothetical protein [Aureimonas sp. SK2]|uniref:hypothetical protein n=1 Tax=Aureimonas sp. SK2 TaxID=3015992 RepID=UPI0024445189|nr:hypothetical protein [Aureimonas sp. SK2]